MLRRIESSDVGLRLARGMFWSMAGTLISRGSMLLATIFVARMLGKSGFGELGAITSTVAMIGTFAGFGLGVTANKHVAQYRESDPGKAGRILGLSGCFAAATGIAMGLALFFAAPWLADRSLNAPHLSGEFQVASLLIALHAINGAQTGALAGFEAFRTVAKVNLAVGLVSFPMIVIGTAIGGLTGAVWALVINLAINWLLNHLALRHEARKHHVAIDVRGIAAELPIIWTFSLPAMLAASMVGPARWICIALLANTPDGYAELGVVNATQQWFMLLLYLPSVMSTVLLPLLSSKLEAKNTKDARRALLYGIVTNLAVAVPVGLVVCLLSRWIMALYGPGFENGWLVLVVTVATAVLLSSQTPVGQVIAASGKMWIGFATNMAWAIVLVSVAYALLDLGALGLALATFISYLAHATWTFAFAFWFIKRAET